MRKHFCSISASLTSSSKGALSLTPGFSQVIGETGKRGNRLNGFSIKAGNLFTWLKAGANEMSNPFWFVDCRLKFLLNHSFFLGGAGRPYLCKAILNES